MKLEIMVILAEMLKEEFHFVSVCNVLYTMVLTASAWAADGDIYKQTLEVANLGATQNGVLVISSTATDEQYNQAYQADLCIRGQGAGYVLIKAYGDVPTINIPLAIILL